MQSNLLFLLLLMSIEFFSAVQALHFYQQGVGKEDDSERDALKSGKCTENSTGCNAILNCGIGRRAFRGCTSHMDICQTKLAKGKTFQDMCKHCEYCSGNLCNNEGLEKTGLKCIGRDEDSNVTFVEECLKGTVGCVAAWDCKDAAAPTVYGCSSEKDFCKQRVNNVCNCQYCTTDLCNIGGIKEKPTTGGKPTQPNMPKPTKKPKPMKMPTSPKTEIAVGSVEVQESTPMNGGEKSEGENEEAPADPPNGAVGIACWGKIGIIPIGMLPLGLGAGLLLKMLTI